MNKTVKIEWTLGNFSVASTMEMDDAQQAAAMALGALYLHQRVSKVDKTLGGYEGDKRKDKWKRGNVDYSAELASKLVEDFAGLKFPKEYEGVAALRPTVSVSEYVRDVAELKYVMARGAADRHESAGDLEEWLVNKIGFKGPTHTADGEDFNPEMLRAIDTFVKNNF